MKEKDRFVKPVTKAQVRLVSYLVKITPGLNTDQLGIDVSTSIPLR